MEPCRVLLVDDHTLLMEGVRSLLAPCEEFHVVGMAVSGEDALELARTRTPHVAVMDISMPGMNGVETTRALRERCPEVRVVIYTMHTDQRFLLELLQAGITGHVLKSDPPSTLLRALRLARRGEPFFSGRDPRGQLTAMMRDSPQNAGDDPMDNLSPREMQIFRLLADGQSIRAIADALYISPKTVETHKYNIFTKLQVTSLSALTRLAIRHGLVPV